MTDSNEQYQRGLSIGRMLGGESFDDVVANLGEIDSELPEYLVAHAYGRVMARSVLSLADRELVIIAAVAVRGHQEQLKWHVQAALNVGLDAVTIREVLVQVQPFSGWPACQNALSTFKQALDERGLTLPASDSAEADTPREILRERGRSNGGKVYANYAAIEDRLRAFDPELPNYLTEHAYGQVYARPGLDMRQRELIAVAILTVLESPAQLAGHIIGAHRVGCSKAETLEVIVLMHLYAGWPIMLNALEVWGKVSARQPSANLPK